MARLRYRISWLIALKTFSDVGSRGASFILILLAARYLEPAAFGLFSLGWAGGWILSIASDLGLQISVAREIAARPLTTVRVVSQLLRLRLLLAGGLFACMVGLYRFFWWDTGGAALVGLLGVQLISSLIDFCNHVFRGLERSDLESWINLVHRLAALSLGGLLLVLAPNLDGLVIVLLLVSACVLLIAGRLVTRLLPGLWDWEASGESRLRAFELGRQVLPIGLGILASAIYFRLDLFFLERYWGRMEVGLYTAAFRLLDGLRIFPAAVLAVLFPWLCRSTSKRQPAALAALLSLAGVAGALLLGVNPGGLLFLLYGQSYMTAGPALAILALALPLLFLNLVLTHQLIAWRQSSAYMWSCIGVLAATVPLNWAWIPTGGLQGAAWAVLFREAILSLVCLVIVGLARPLTEPGDEGDPTAAASGV